MDHAHTNIAPANWFPHDRCPGDPEAPLVERTIANGTSQFVYQCRRCRRPRPCRAEAAA